MEATQQALSVIAVLGLLGATLWWLRRFVKRAPRSAGVSFAGIFAGNKEGRRMEVLERLPLGPQHSLYLVRVADRNLLIALSAAGCQVLETPAVEITR